MDFSTIKGLSIPEGVVTKISDKDGHILWSKQEDFNGLCFTAEEANSSVELTAVGTPSIANTAYSLDGKNWVSFTPSTTAGTNTINLSKVGDKVYFRNDITNNFEGSSYLVFVMSGKIAGSGNINSIYTSNNFNDLETLIYTYCFAYLFNKCASLTTPPSLPATTLSKGCYYSMFASCTSLHTAPVLPATNIASNCYVSMFFNCSSLIVSDTSSESASHYWRIPKSGTWHTRYAQSYVFLSCAGTRTNDDITASQYYVAHYTQNEPV